MADLNASIVSSFVAAIETGASESASAYSRTFGEEITLAVGKSGEFDTSLFSSEFWKKGLALLLCSGEHGIAVLIPSGTGLVPDWCETPDATGKSKLATFAQEWGMNMLPDDFFPDTCEAAIVTNLAEAVKENAKLGAAAGYITLDITKNGVTHSALLLFPLVEPKALLKNIFVAAAASATPSLDIPTLTPPKMDMGIPMGNFVGSGAPPTDGMQSKTFSKDDLPGFSHSLLRVCLPVAVVLARKREPIKKILELGVGSIVQFDKSCDEMIELEVDKTLVASGEAVKVGEMFGLRISAIHLPQERFRKVDIRREGEFRTQTNPQQIVGKAPIRSLEPAAKSG